MTQPSQDLQDQFNFQLSLLRLLEFQNANTSTAVIRPAESAEQEYLQEAISKAIGTGRAV